MDTLCSTLLLLTVPSWVLSQVTLQESGPGLVRPAQTLTLTCSFSGFSLRTAGLGVGWVRQPPGKALEWLANIWWNDDKYYSPSLKSRLSISKDTSRNQVVLRMTSMDPADTATYFCTQMYYAMDYWGQGTLVTVSSADPTSPSLFPLSLRSTDQAGNVVIGCLIRGFFPSEPMNVTWSHSGEAVSTRNFPPVQAADGGLYSMTSQLTLPAAQCSDGATKTCRVQHNSNFNKAVDVPCKEGEDKLCPLPLNCEPQLSLHRPALEDLLLGSNANLTCTLSGLKDPKGATFTWKPSGGKDAIQGTPQRDSCGCYSVSSILPGCAEPWNRGETFSCTVTHPESKDPKTATITKASGSAFRPQVHLLPPPSEEVALNELVTLTCLVRGFSPEDVLVRWLHGTQELPRDKYLTWGPLPEASQGVTTFAVTSVLRVEAENWKNGDNFSCMVGHETLPLAFTQKTIDRLAGSWCLAECLETLPWAVLDLQAEELEEDSPGASLWPTTVTLLTLFLLSLFYSTALTVTSIRDPSGSKEGPQY